MVYARSGHEASRDGRYHGIAAHGLALTRLMVGDGSHENMYTKLDELQVYYPDLEIRKPEHDSRRTPALQQIGSKEVWSNREKIGFVAGQVAIDALFKRVPSLCQAIPIRAVWVDTNVDKRTGATFVNIVPHALDELKLTKERYNSLAVLEDLAEREGLVWEPRIPQITIAYVPESASPAAVVDTIKALESSLSPESPLNVTLLPARPPTEFF